MLKFLQEASLFGVIGIGTYTAIICVGLTSILIFFIIKGIGKMLDSIIF